MYPRPKTHESNRIKKNRQNNKSDCSFNLKQKFKKNLKPITFGRS